MFDADAPSKPAYPEHILRSADPSALEQMAAFGDEMVQNAFDNIINHEADTKAATLHQLADVFISTLETDLALAALPTLGEEQT